MCGTDDNALSALEWRLITTSFGGQDAALRAEDAAAASPDELRPLELAVELVESGCFLDVFATPLAAAVLPAPGDKGREGASGEAAASYYDLVRASVASHAARGGNRGALEVLCVGAAALQLVAQANVTGPAVAAPVAACPATLAHASDVDCAVWDEWALQQLSADGEEVIGKTALPQYLVLARIALLESQQRLPPGPFDDDDVALLSIEDALARSPSEADKLDTLSTCAWWAGRCALLQQRLLARGAVSLRRSMVTSFARTLARHASPGVVAHGSRAERRVAAAALLEAALVEFEYKHSEAAAALLSRACAALKLRYAVTGAMGMRTVHQQEAKAQMVLRWALDTGLQVCPAERGSTLPPLPLTGQPHQYADAAETTASVAYASNSGSVATLLGEAPEESDVFHAPHLTSQHDDELLLSDTELPPLEAAAMLVAALCVRKGRAADELRPWEMAPFIEAVRAQATGAPLVRASADLLASRHERSRGRTAARALAGLEALVQGLAGMELQHSGAAPDACATAAQRARLAWSTWLPPTPALRREFGEQLLSTGLVGPAMEQFEALELWDALVLCLQLAGKRAEAAAIVRRRLEVAPRDARLWCALGDATLQEEHYHTAWSVSNGRSARAQRCLARGAARRQDWAASAAAWRAALGVNPLHADGWFGLGYAELQLGNDAAALTAFSRVTQQEPSHAEAWNNVAALSLRCGKKAAALCALTECVRHRRDDWRVWDNMASVASACGEWATAAHAATKLLAVSLGKRTPGIDVLQALTDAAVVQGPQSLLASQMTDILRDACAAGSSGSVGSSAASIWHMSARLRTAAGEHSSAAEFLARRLRALQGTPWDSDGDAFQAFADASTDLAQSAVQHGGSHELASSRLHLRGTIKRAAERFSEHPAFARLQTSLDQVEAKRTAEGQ